MMKYGKNILTMVVLLMGLIFVKIPVSATNIFTVTGECVKGQKVNLNITINVEGSGISGFDIYRSESQNGTYEYIGNINLLDSDEDEDDDYDFDDDWWYEDDEDAHDYSFTDDSTLNAYQSYYYKVTAYVLKDNVKTELHSENIEVLIKQDGPSITYGKRNSKTNAKIKWSKVADAEGYLIYCAKDYDTKSNYQYVVLSDETQFKLVKTVKNVNTTSATFKKLMNGVTYTYRVYAYKTVNGQRVLTSSSEPKSILMNYYSYAGEDYYQKTKRAFGSEKKKAKNFKTSSKAAKQMKRIKIKVWDYKNGKNGKKITRTKWLTVNKRMAPSIKAMFDELYKSKEKQVIHDIGCYSYRTGEHMYGLAIDINPNENYMIDGKKKLAGSFWKPKKNKYSIPLDCEFVRIMKRYGFKRGFWGNRKDYMHFSYFGT